MNVRPSRVPSAPQQADYAAQQPQDHRRAYAEPHTDATFDEVERPNNVPATRPPPQRAPQAVTERDPEPEAARLPDTGLEKLAAAIAAVMAEIKPVEKEGWNDFHRYRYAKMQDLSRELTPLMGKHGIVVFQTEDGRELFDEGKAVAVRYRFTVVHKSGQIWPERPIQTGLASCRTSKGTFDDKALNKCHTSARKYFLLSLFQIPTADEEDADGDHGNGNGQARARPQATRRPVPSTSGKLPPHFVPIVDGEQPDAWAKRFNAFIDKAESKDEIDKWYDANAGVFDKLKARYETLYNSLLDHMDARTAKLAAPAGDFPGDTPPPKDDPISSGPARKPLSDTDQRWLTELRDAFEQCEDGEELASIKRSIMDPAGGEVSSRALAEAEALYSTNKARFNG